MIKWDLVLFFRFHVSAHVCFYRVSAAGRKKSDWTDNLQGFQGTIWNEHPVVQTVCIHHVPKTDITGTIRIRIPCQLNIPTYLWTHVIKFAIYL